MNPTTQAALAIAVQVDVPVIVTGWAGIGKTSQLRYLAQLKNWGYHELNPSAMLPEDFSIPTENKGRGYAEKLPWKWAVELAAGGPSLLVIDECNTGTESVEASLLKVVLDRLVGDTKLPNTRVVSLQNPPALAPGGRELSGPMANRYCHLSAKVHWQSLRQGQLTGIYPMAMPLLPENWRDHLQAARTLIVSFLDRHENLICDELPEGHPGLSGPWGSPRTWFAYAAPLLAACFSLGLNTESAVAQMLICGCVGDGAGGQFCTWATLVHDTPTPEMVWADPRGVSLPARDDLITATLNSLVAATAASIANDAQTLAEKRNQAAWTVIKRVVDELGKADLAAGAGIPLRNIMPSTFRMPPEAAALAPIIERARAAAQRAMGGSR